MLVALIAHDKSDAGSLRADNRAAHLAYLEQNNEIVSQAGPFLDEDDAMIGSLIILDVPDMKTAVLFAKDDPYAIAGLFDQATLTPWKRVIG
jgi:uncharacterized protein YciI